MAVEALTPVEVEQYLARIGYKGPREPTPEALSKLQKCHMLSVPFENLSVYGKEEIFLTKDWLYDKIVRRHRGGFCYELNTIFAFLLDYFGFDYKTYGSRVYSRFTGTLGPPNHMLMIVNIEGKRWLSDVGFADGSWTPLLLTGLGEEQKNETGIFRICKVGDVYRIDEKFKIIVDESGNEELAKGKFICPDDHLWEPRHQFDITTTTQDFTKELEYNQKSPKAPFTHGRFCTVPKPWGKITLVGNKVITTTYLGNNKVKKDSKELSGEDEIVKQLEENFGLIRNQCLYPEGSLSA